MIEASANIGVQRSVCALLVVRSIFLFFSTERWADPPFIDTRRDSVHAQGIMEVVVFSPNRGGAVVEHCGKYTGGYGAGRGSHPGHRPWSCRDHAGFLAAPAGGVVIAVGGTVLQAWRGGVPRVLQARVLSRSRPEPPPRVVPMPFEGSTEGKVRRRYGELVAQWLKQCRARSALHRRFPQYRHSVRYGRAVTGVGGRDSGHSHCEEWWPDAV